MKKQNITSIRILSNDKTTFKTESEFKNFIENTMIARGGYYYFPSQMMNCTKNTLVLLQYNGMIRAYGVLVDLRKTSAVDEFDMKYAGYYKFDPKTLKYLENPLKKEALKSVFPLFNNFSQSKQIISLEYLDGILKLLNNDESIIV